MTIDGHMRSPSGLSASPNLQSSGGPQPGNTPAAPGKPPGGPQPGSTPAAPGKPPGGPKPGDTPSAPPR